MNPIITKILGIFSSGNVVKDLGDIVDNVTTNKEEKIKAVTEYYTSIAESGLKQYEAEIRDRETARLREIEIAKVGKTDWMMKVVGMVGLASFMFLIYALIFRTIPSDNKELFAHLIGIVEGVALGIFGYYFGTSRSSDRKTEILSKK